MPACQPIRFKCPACFERLRVPYDDRRKTMRCPRCKILIQLATHQLVWPELKGRIQQWKDKRAAETKKQERQRLLEEERQRRSLVVAQQAQQAQIERQAYYEAVVSGRVFDLNILVPEFIDDWTELQRKTELTPLQISQGIKTASPVAGVGAAWATGNPWVGLAVAVGAFLASGSIGEEYAKEKFMEWRTKWVKIFSNCTQSQLAEFDSRLKERSPLIYNSLNANNQMYLP